MTDNFKLFFDVDIEKANSSGTDVVTDENRYDNMIFSGVASDMTKDAEGEVLDPNGFVYDRFLKSGLINLDHLPTRSPINKSRFWIGEPIDAYVKDNKFFIKGKLWKKSPEARAFWDKALEMKESGSKRRPGMSVEGKALERDKNNPQKVTKALICNVALTMTPVNPSTYVDLQKSIRNHSKVILFEELVGNKLIRIDKGFNIQVLDSFEPTLEKLKLLYKSFKDKEISEKVIRSFIKNNLNQFVN